MPAPEPQHLQLLLTVLGTAVTTAGPILFFGLRAMTKLQTQVELFHIQNGIEHLVVFEKLDTLNGTGRKNETAIAEREAVCNERHPKK